MKKMFILYPQVSIAYSFSLSSFSYYRLLGSSSCLIIPFIPSLLFFFKTTPL
ncbi:hypothetical protein K450DRAFT_239077 [Umbelopsis ramanniana AG]|uniref:Uncharacterized protein n=1 Tax=Umbelopsis ramanniana AG TaxID=1314678 RepID=A0AAD5E9W6_UMBRA|nr:uncharacterized protein K450DRAFT_239077 [Umbelopsis ramanniana AG]KAI8580041.1 hypothetical protein K450DRAFT_239077 [Umbelopsis ramanniana AG]